MNKTKNSKTKLKVESPISAIAAKKMSRLAISDLLSLAAKLWLKFEAIINYNLLWFLIYTYLVGIMNLTWMIFIPALTNSISAIVEYILSLVNRTRK